MDRLMIIGSGKRINTNVVGEYDVMAVNKEIRRYKDAKHHVSVHDLFHVRSDAVKHSCRRYNNIDCIWDYKNEGGGSALLALHVALRLGYGKIAFCSTPLDGDYYSWATKQIWLKYIEDNKGIIQDKVRSYSGKTMELFGNAEGWF